MSPVPGGPEVVQAGAGPSGGVGYRVLRARAASAGRGLIRHLDDRGRIKVGANHAVVRMALAEFEKSLSRLGGDTSKAVADANRLAIHVRSQLNRVATLPIRYDVRGEGRRADDVRSWVQALARRRLGLP